MTTIGYRAMYALGITPWDQDDPPEELLRVVDGPRALPPGRALDLGCGTGADAVFLATRGWKVTGVDSVPKALDAARRRSAEAGVDVDWRRGEVGALADAGVEGLFDLVYDVGCFHGLSDAARARCADAITSMAGPAAVLLVFAFVPGRRGPAPRGIGEAELVDRFGPHWKLVHRRRAEDVQLAGPLRNADPHWYRFARTG